MDIQSIKQHINERGLAATVLLGIKRRRSSSKSSLRTTCDDLSRRIKELEKQSEQQNKQIVSMNKTLAEQSQLTNALKLTLLKTLAEQSLDLLHACNEGEDKFDAVLSALGMYYEIAFPDGYRKSDDSTVLEFLGNLKELESADFSKKLRAEYIKIRIPQAYTSQAQEAIKPKKALFLQPRCGLNQAFKYMFNYLKERGYEVKLFELDRGDIPLSLYYWRAERFAEEAATSRVVFVHESNDLLGHVSIRDDSKVVQLWHGCGVFKKIGLDTAGLPGYKGKKAYEEYPEYNYYSLVTIASPDQSWVFEQFMGIDKESGIIQPTGVSRTDYFFDEGYINQSYKKLYECIPQAKEKKVILYAPTYRGVGKGRTAPDVLDIELMARHLSDEYILIVKQHQTVKEIPEIPESVCNIFAFDMTRGWGMDISELMTVSDICISDYSSLVCEFSLFERPMAFFVYDLEDYIDSRGLYYDFDEITPGPLCKTTEELVDYIKNINERFDKEQVISFKKKFMGSCDGHSTERIVSFVENDVV